MLLALDSINNCDAGSFHIQRDVPFRISRSGETTRKKNRAHAHLHIFSVRRPLTSNCAFNFVVCTSFKKLSP